MVSLRNSCPTILLGAALGACADPGHLGPGPKHLVLTGETCSGEVPTCVSSCASDEPGEPAVCEQGRWHCSAGIRASLCCDPSTSPDHCPLWEASCSEQRPCPSGYTCVRSMTHPVPDLDGVCRLGNLAFTSVQTSCGDQGLTSPELLAVLDAAAVKVEGLVVIDTSCEKRSCSVSNPCCAQCTGSYRLEMQGGERDEGVTVPLRTPTIACTGTACGLTCSPLEPGRRYRLWGTFIPKPGGLHLGTIHYVGGCLL